MQADLAAKSFCCLENMDFNHPKEAKEQLPYSLPEV